MGRMRVFVVALLFAACAPSALASEEFTSTSIVLSGDVTFDAGGGAVFVIGGAEDFAWDVVASDVTVHRMYTNITRVGDRPSFELQGAKPGEAAIEEDLRFGPARLVSGAARPSVALLAIPLGDSFAVRGSTSGITQATPVSDPHIEQERKVVQATMPGDTAPLYYGVMADLVGDFVNVSTHATDYELRGDLVLQVYDVDYVVRTESNDAPMRTGYYDVDDAPTPIALVRQERLEMHTITLRDAILHIRAPEFSSAYSPAPTLAFAGTVRADNASDGATEYALDGTLFMNARDGRLGVATAGSPTGVPLAAPTRTTTLGLVALVVTLAVGAFVAVALVRRRRSGASLEAALLAMEERRWEEALDHLDQLVAKAPDDAVLLVDRALCLEQVGRLPDARAACEAALAQEPRSAEAHYYYARVLARMRMSTAAFAHLEQALVLDRRLSELARVEPAFRAYRDEPQFAALVS